MKTLKIILVLVIVTTTITSCKDPEKQKRDAYVDAYTQYVDSISNLDMENHNMKWSEIDNRVRDKRSEAENQLYAINEDTNERERQQKRIQEASEKYDEYKRNVEEKLILEASKAKLAFSNTLFKNQIIGDDMNFDWVNKDNILETYDYFVTTVDNNKDTYTREQWDQIKMLYEALDSRKNTVEKEGLSSKDNNKIAALKLKFAPMYALKRAGAKAEE